MLQNKLWASGSRPCMPKSSWGRSRSSPNRPFCRKSPGNQPDLAKDGSSKVYSHTTKPADKPRHRPGPRPAPPVHAAQHRRRELGHRRKADQADAHQRMGLARQSEIQIGQQQDQHDRPAPDAQQHPRDILLALQRQPAVAQQEWHHEVVADHRGQRDGLHHDHPGGRRQATDKHHQRQPVVPRTPSAAGARRCRHPPAGPQTASGRPAQSATRTR